jgi:hypothetical protein
MALVPRRHPLNLIRVMPAKGAKVMATSTYLARLIGPVLAVVGLGMLLSPGHYLAVVADVLRSPALLYLASVIGLLAGLALVLAHNVWTADWRVIITLLGWISILDSASWLLLRDEVERLWSPLLGSRALPLWGGGVVLLIGAVLSYFGYAGGKRA